MEERTLGDVCGGFIDVFGKSELSKKGREIGLEVAFFTGAVAVFEMLRDDVSKSQKFDALESELKRFIEAVLDEGY